MLHKILPDNFITLCDSYKLTHFKQMSELRDQTKGECKRVQVAVTARKGNKFGDEIVMAGSNLLVQMLDAVRITSQDIAEARVEAAEQGYEFNEEGWRHIVYDCNGRLPLDIVGLPEGTVVLAGTPLLLIENTTDDSYWLPGYIERFVQAYLWKMSTVATIARQIYLRLMEVAKITGMNPLGVEYKLHNFGDRGADGNEAAIIAAISHAMLFSGSDCFAANRYIKRLYRTVKPYLSSIDATEHSTMTMNSDCENRDDRGAAHMAVRMLESAVERSKRGIGIPMIANVIDTYDSKRYVRDYLGTEPLRSRIINSGGTMVARPDSGDPMVEPIEIINLLRNAFGGIINEETYFVLNNCVRVIQGDGMNQGSLYQLLDNLVAAKLSLDNLAFGMGSGLTHDAGRDEFSFCLKAVAWFDGEKWHALNKDPITDPGKRSIGGYIVVFKNNLTGEIRRIKQEDYYQMSVEQIKQWDMAMVLLMSNGYLRENNVPDFDEVRDRARNTVVYRPD